VTARSKARKRALDVLFEADQRGSDPLTTVQERSGQALAPFAEYAFDLVAGVTQHRVEIDQILAEYAEGWTLDRMPAVDRTVLRLGTYELLFADDVPEGVAISEAVALARELSTDASPGFVNGLLAKIASVEPARRPELTLADAGHDTDGPGQASGANSPQNERTVDSRDDIESPQPPTGSRVETG
jgi:N utilization substance protein B